MFSPKEVDETIYPNTICNEMNNDIISSLAIDSALEIDGYMGNGKIIHNAFSKLAKILYNTLTPRKHLKGQRPIDDAFTLLLFRDLLKRYEKDRKERGMKIDYQLDDSTLTNEVKDQIVPIIYSLSQDLSDFTKLSKERQTSLKDFCMNLHQSLSRTYNYGGIRYLLAD